MEVSERRCVICGKAAARENMIRFALAPDGLPVADLKERLPGRGFWICADRTAFSQAVLSGRFTSMVARALKQPFKGGKALADLPDQLDRLLETRLLERLGLARRSGALICGFEKVRDALRAGHVTIMLEAKDAAPDGGRKLRNCAESTVTIAALFTRDQLSLALGRENVVHAAIVSDDGTKMLFRDLKRLAAWRNEPLYSTTGALPDLEKAQER